MRNRLQLGTMYYLVAIGLVVYAVGIGVAITKIERKIIFISVTTAAGPPAPVWPYFLFGLPLLPAGCSLLVAIVRRTHRRRPKHCRYCGRWIGDERRCHACGVASQIFPVAGRGFTVLPPTASLAADAD